jgi:signal peptidase II
MRPAYTKPFLIVILIVLVDQIIKTWVRTHMFLGQDIHFLGDHGMLHYTENNGMAFGMELGGSFGKLVLTLFRICAVFGIGYVLVYLISHKYHRGLITCVALILAGALGNIVDSTIYGPLYQHGDLFYGRVVDSQAISLTGSRYGVARIISSSARYLTWLIQPYLLALSVY